MAAESSSSSASSLSGSNGFNMGSLSSALNDVSASIEEAKMASLLDMFADVKISVKKIAEKKMRSRSQPRGKRQTQAEKAHELKMIELQRQLRKETNAVERAIRELTKLMRSGSSNVANARAIEEARAAVNASQKRLARITSQINNPHNGMNANVGNNGRSMSRGKSRNRNSMNNNNRNRSPRRGGATRKRRNNK